MKYLCVDPIGNFEIWDEHWSGDLWQLVFEKDGEMFTINAFVPGPIEFWGREILEEWTE